MKLVIKMLVTLTIIGVVSGALLSEISSWAEPKIAAHRKAETEKAIFIVQPNAKTYEVIDKVNFELYKVFDENKQNLGYAMPIEGNGFQGNVRLMLGVKMDLKEVVGMMVLEQVETPGLGTKIVEDASQKSDPLWFPNQFKGSMADPELSVVKNQEPSTDSEIQAITGATISSKAVVKIINVGLTKLRNERNSGGEL